MSKTLSRIFLIVLLTPVLACAVWCGFAIDRLSDERKTIKQDYAELNNIQYGLLSVDAWRDHITMIVSEQIQEFHFDGKQEAVLKIQLNTILNSLVTQANHMVNEKQKTFKGKVRKVVAKALVNFDKVRERVPEFSQTIINELKKPQSKERLELLAKEKLKEFADQTHDNLSSKSNFQKILTKYHSENIVVFNQKIEAKLQSMQRLTYYYTYALLVCLLFFLALWIVLRKQSALHTPLFVMSVLLAMIVLIVGLSAPMIEIDARIKELNFTLIGKHMIFHDQVLFFQSKSILDVVHILIATHKADSVLVGILILIFSVAFPILKLVSTKIYLLGKEKWRGNKVLKFFAFKSGKWSMADVMVVAIMMTYIGFKGILDNQMKGLTMQTDSLDAIATNETSLQPGFLLFISYVIFGLILGVILKQITRQQNRAAFYASVNRPNDPAVLPMPRLAQTLSKKIFPKAY